MAIVIQNQAFQTAQQQGIREIPVVESSYLQKFSYNPTTLQLTVTMKQGGEYTYFNVSPSTVDELAQSKSKGSFYANVIKTQGPATRTVDKRIGETRVRTPLSRPIQSHKT